MKKVIKESGKNKVSKKEKDDDSIIFDLPEVKDIPGQENIRPPHLREMADTTASSADEEGEGLLDDLNEDDEIAGSNVTSSEKKLLRQTDRPITDETVDRLRMKLDDTDGDDKLNESGDPEDLGEDLDMPESDEDEDDPSTEDEANNTFK